MEKIIGLKEFRQKVNHLAKEVGKGQSFIIVRRSKPLFRIVPLQEQNENDQWVTLIDFTKINPRGVAIEQIIKALKDGQSKKGHRKTAKRV